MYGTILEQDDSVEAIDMYIYRSAESKAKKIGLVSRVLKETAIDCLLQPSSENMTIENMNQNVSLNLSNKKIIDFNIGDEPYSSTCDYMQSCDYKCKIIHNNDIVDSSTMVDKSQVDSSTISQRHLNNNIVSLKNRIKDLFFEKYVYTRDDIDKLVNYNKIYNPYQIELALKELTNDNLELVVDKYDRKGYVVAIDDLYIFQPFQIRNKNVVMEHRTLPLFHKREFIPLKLNKSVKKESNTQNEGIFITEDFNNRQLIDNVNKYMETHIWNKHKSLYEGILTIIQGNNLENVMDHISVFHYLDTQVTYKLKLKMLKDYYADKTKFQEYLQNYFDKFIFESKFYDGFIINRDSDLILHRYDKVENEWHETILTDSSSYSQFREVIDNKFKITLNNQMLGYYYPNKKHILQFKMKSIMNSGERGKSGTICDKLDLTYIKTYTDSLFSFMNEKQVSQIQLLLDSNTMTRKSICAMIELLLRYFDYKNFNEKTWFVSPHIALFNKAFNNIKV